MKTLKNLFLFLLTFIAIFNINTNLIAMNNQNNDIHSDDVDQLDFNQPRINSSPNLNDSPYSLSPNMLSPINMFSPTNTQESTQKTTKGLILEPSPQKRTKHTDEEPDLGLIYTPGLDVLNSSSNNTSSSTTALPQSSNSSSTNFNPIVFDMESIALPPDLFDYLDVNVTDNESLGIAKELSETGTTNNTTKRKTRKKSLRIISLKGLENPANQDLANELIELRQQATTAYNQSNFFKNGIFPDNKLHTAIQLLTTIITKIKQSKKYNQFGKYIQFTYRALGKIQAELNKKNIILRPEEKISIKAIESKISQSKTNFKDANQLLLEAAVICDKLKESPTTKNHLIDQIYRKLGHIFYMEQTNTNNMSTTTSSTQQTTSTSTSNPNNNASTNKIALVSAQNTQVITEQPSPKKRTKSTNEEPDFDLRDAPGLEVLDSSSNNTSSSTTALPQSSNNSSTNNSSTNFNLIDFDKDSFALLSDAFDCLDANISYNENSTISEEPSKTGTTNNTIWSNLKNKLDALQQQANSAYDKSNFPVEGFNNDELQKAIKHFMAILTEINQSERPKQFNTLSITTYRAIGRIQARLNKKDVTLKPETTNSIRAIESKINQGKEQIKTNLNDANKLLLDAAAMCDKLEYSKKLDTLRGKIYYNLGCIFYKEHTNTNNMSTTTSSTQPTTTSTTSNINFN
jgi:hypothetical protein